MYIDYSVWGGENGVSWYLLTSTYEWWCGLKSKFWMGGLVDSLLVYDPILSSPIIIVNIQCSFFLLTSYVRSLFSLSFFFGG